VRHDDDLIHYFKIHDKTELYRRKMEKYQKDDPEKYKNYLEKYLKSIREENDFYGQLFYSHKMIKNEVSFSYHAKNE